MLPHKTPRLATENYNELISLDESKHSADCPSIQVNNFDNKVAMFIKFNYFFCRINLNDAHLKIVCTVEQSITSVLLR